MIVVSLAISVPLFFIFFYLLKFSIFNALLTSIIISLLPILIYNSVLNRIERKKEEMFIKFAIDLAHLLKSGLPLKNALKEIERIDYDVLNPLILNLSARIDWGLSLIESFEKFAEESNNSTIKRAIRLILDIYKAGGDLGSSLEATINSILEIRKMKKEREALIHENILDAYLVFFFFLGIIITLMVFLIPFLQFSLPGEENKLSPDTFYNVLYFLSIVQSVFAGLALGKMYEGRFMAGAKHILIFLLLVMLIFNVVIPILPKGQLMFDIIKM